MNATEQDSWAQSVAKHAAKTGTIHLGGEMTLKANDYIQNTRRDAARIAEDCGYIVSMHGSSRMHISGGDISGYVVLDWFDASRPGPEKIEHWAESAAYVSDYAKAVAAVPHE